MDTLKGVCVVAHPEFVKPREDTIIGTSATGCAGLDGHIRIFRTDAVAHLRKTTVILYIQMALLILREILRTMIHDGHVRIPLDVINIRVFCHDPVNNPEHMVLDFWI